MKKLLKYKKIKKIYNLIKLMKQKQYVKNY